MCPICNSPKKAARNGFYLRSSDGQNMRRYRCPDCRKTFSETKLSIDYRLRKRSINQMVFKILSSGVSQRRCSFFVNIKPIGIARRVDRFGACGEANLKVYRESRDKASTVLIDEMESFEHTKCKPLTIPIIVEEKTRKILSVRVGSIAAKGHLAALSRARYGYRKCERTRCLTEVLTELKTCFIPQGIIKSDQSKHYPNLIASMFKEACHVAYKGRRGCVVGQGELKAGGFDPLFSLNHTYAMVRDNLKTLSRRTWCTCKRPDRLQSLLNIYSWFHNLWLDRKKAKIRLSWPKVTI